MEQMTKKKNSIVQSLSFLLLVVLLTTNISCSNTVGESKEKAVNIESLIKEYDTYTNQNRASDDDIFQKEWGCIVTDTIASPHGNPQGLCCLCNWWIEDSTLPIATNGRKLEQLYNTYAYSNSIWADYEIWARSSITGNVGLVSNDSIISAIRNVNYNAVKDPRYSKQALRFKNQMVSLLRDKTSWSEKHSPGYAAYQYDSLVTNRIALEIVDTTMIDKYFNSIDSLLLRCLSVQEEISKYEEGKRFKAILDKIQQARSFDEQCAIALVCSSRSSTYNGLWSLRLLKQILESGHYSILLERMWIVWRAFAQQDMCGMSRDSYIPNYNYDKLRKRIFKTIVKHLSNSNDDKMAIIQTVFLASHPCLIRNGSFIAGNDAPMEIMNYCPHFYN